MDDVLDFKVTGFANRRTLGESILDPTVNDEGYSWEFCNKVLKDKSSWKRHVRNVESKRFDSSERVEYYISGEGKFSELKLCRKKELVKTFEFSSEDLKKTHFENSAVNRILTSRKKEREERANKGKRNLFVDMYL